MFKNGKEKKYLCVLLYILCNDYSVIMQHVLDFNLFFFPFKVLQCKCSFNMVTFPVTVTQQSPAAVSMDTYQVSMEAMEAQVKTANEAKLLLGFCLHVYCCVLIIRLV